MNNDEGKHFFLNVINYGENKIRPQAYIADLV